MRSYLKCLFLIIKIAAPWPSPLKKKKKIAFLFGLEVCAPKNRSRRQYFIIILLSAIETINNPKRSKQSFKELHWHFLWRLFRQFFLSFLKSNVTDSATSRSSKWLWYEYWNHHFTLTLWPEYCFSFFFFFR